MHCLTKQLVEVDDDGDFNPLPKTQFWTSKSHKVTLTWANALCLASTLFMTWPALR